MATDRKERKAKAVGINHIALEVGDIDEAMDFYSSFIDFKIENASRDPEVSFQDSARDMLYHIHTYPHDFRRLTR